MEVTVQSQVVEMCKKWLSCLKGAVGASGVGLLCHSASGTELHLQLLDEGMLAHLQTSCCFLHALPGLGQSRMLSLHLDGMVIQC